ncbi:hypothetical protein M514_23318 [Trichuris suis]|uniref:Uncharacterized protein n=1 Tax=Trichuris suis TaxID=68888 RepID=A0A085N4S5_9BILA|nr:hypothetical protein M514_23318 [Trichuris suis]
MDVMQWYCHQANLHRHRNAHLRSCGTIEPPGLLRRVNRSSHLRKGVVATKCRDLPVPAAG